MKKYFYVAILLTVIGSGVALAETSTQGVQIGNTVTDVELIDGVIVGSKYDYLSKDLVTAISVSDSRQVKDPVQIVSVAQLASKQKYRVNQGSRVFYTSVYSFDKNGCLGFKNVVLCGDFSITRLPQ